MEYSIDLSYKSECELNFILSNSLYPLTGFLNQKDYNSVISNMTLTNGDLWPIPIVLSIDEQTKEKIKHEEAVILRNTYNLPLAKLHIEEIYKPDIAKEYKKLYSLDDNNNNEILKSMKESKKNIYYVAGKVEKINSISTHIGFEEYIQSPQQLTMLFKSNKWNTIIGYQPKSIMHREHFELTQHALTKLNLQNAKLLIQPIINIDDEEDINYQLKIKCYKHILKYYPKDTALLSLIHLNIHSQTPLLSLREKLLYAIIKRNYGCTHLIVDENDDGANELQKYQDKLNLKIIRLHPMIYVKNENKYKYPDELENESASDIILMTLTKQEQIKLLHKKNLPYWFTYPEINDELKKVIISNI